MTWFKEEFIPDNKYLIIAFGSYFKGIKGKKKEYDPNIFEWTNTLNQIYSIREFNKLYIKDDDDTFWHGRFDSLVPGCHNLANFIKEKSKKANVEKILTVGASMGGYGSIMFTCLCNFDLSISFSPQTYLSNFRYRKNKLNQKYIGLYLNKNDTDIQYLFKNYGIEKSKYYIYIMESIMKQINFKLKD